MKIDLTQSHIQSHPQWQAAQYIAKTLRQKGYEVLFAGGCVRDFLLGVAAQDLDLATNAKPEEIENLFEKTVAVGKAFGVIRVVYNACDIEVASFRKDGLYVDGRRPERVEFSTPFEDASRRDFTINALFMDASSGEVSDYVNGLDDLRTRTIRAVGVAKERFAEDHLRILRALRFVSQLGFSIEAQTQKACFEMRHQISKVSGERRRDEFYKLLKGKFFAQALGPLLQCEIMPELTEVGRAWKYSQCRVEFIESMAVYGEPGLWFGFLSSLKVSWKEAEVFMQELKFSNLVLREVLYSLRIAEKMNEVLKEELGECLTLLHPTRGMIGSLDKATDFLQLSDEQKNILEIRQQRLLELGPQMPAALVKGDDLRDSFAGEKLGAVLKWLYCRQLEGLLVDKESAVVMAKKHFMEGIKL